MAIRLSKVLLTAAIALLFLLVSFGNITDYESNFAYVQHVMQMDTIFPGSTIHYRAIDWPVAHHAVYILLIGLETLTALLCAWGALQLYRHRNASAVEFNRSKRIAVVGLTLGFLLGQVGFMSIGGEWFGMWMSQDWNGVPSAFRFFVTVGIVLIYLVLRDDELTDTA